MSTERPAIRILSVDDHPLLREGVAALLASQPDMTLVAEASNGREAIEQFRKHRPDVTLMDLQMPEMNGVDAIIAISGEFPSARIIVLTTYTGDVQVLRALKAGARAYLLKDSAEADLVSAIQAIIEGKSFFSPGVRALLKEDYIHRLAKFGADDTYELLTAREREVLQLVAEGRSNKEVAALLNLSLYTVETHRTHILQKLNLHSVPDLILYAVRKGIIS